jgi:predicted DNA-binding transcriptional regulator YafY
VPTDLTTFQMVSEAVRKGSVLEFEYKKLNSSSYEKRTVEPYHLACIQNQWYCFGHDINRREMRTFVLARMRAAVGTGQTFLKSKKFSLKDHLKDSLGVFSGKGTHDIRIRFDKFAAQLVRERVWHPSQQIQELTGGGIELRITLSTLHEIEPWILSWGAHAKVLGPKELITRIKQVTQDCSNLYRQRLT